jgi:hypothetical protein
MAELQIEKVQMAATNQFEKRMTADLSTPGGAAQR